MAEKSVLAARAGFRRAPLRFFFRDSGKNLLFWPLKRLGRLGGDGKPAHKKKSPLGGGGQNYYFAGAIWILISGVDSGRKGGPVERTL